MIKKIKHILSWENWYGILSIIPVLLIAISTFKGQLLIAICCIWLAILIQLVAIKYELKTSNNIKLWEIKQNTIQRYRENK